MPVLRRDLAEVERLGINSHKWKVEREEARIEFLCSFPNADSESNQNAQFCPKLNYSTTDTNWESLIFGDYNADLSDQQALNYLTFLEINIRGSIFCRDTGEPQA